MAEPPPGRDAYLAGIAARLTGSRRARERLLTEIGDHLDDAIAAGIGPADEVEQRAIDLLGPPETVARAWSARCSRVRGRQRRRVALVVAAATAASLLAVTQHADGRRDQVRPTGACAAQHGVVVRACGEPSR